MRRLGGTRLGVTEEGFAGVAVDEAPPPTPEIQYDALDTNVRPPFDVWTDLCTVHLIPGTWLVGGEAFLWSEIDDTDTWAAIYDHDADTYYNVTYCHCDAQGESNGYRTVYVQDILEIATETDVSLRWRSRGTISAVPQGVVVAAKNDERTIGSGSYWFTTAAGVDLTHLTAVPIDGLDYLRDVVAVDTLLAVQNTNYPVMTLDLTDGAWVVLANFAITSLGPQAGGGLADHAAGMISVNDEVFRYVDDGQRSGGHGYNPIFNQHGIVRTAVEGHHVEALATVVTTDADNIYVRADWGILDHGGSPVTDPPADSYTTGSLLAIKVPSSDDAVSSLLTANTTATADQWVNGPQVTVGEGTWLVWGTAHLYVNAPHSGFVWGCEIEAEGSEYAIAAREGWGDPAGEALVVNSVMQLVTVPEGGFEVVRIRGWATGFPLTGGGPGDPGGPGLWSSTLIFTILCPEIVWVLGPGSPGGPGTPGQPTSQAHASTITAVRLPIDLTSFTSLRQVVLLPGSEDIGGGPVPTFSTPTVELYRLPI